MNKVNVRGRRGIGQRKTARKGSSFSRRRAATSPTTDAKRKRSKPEHELIQLLLSKGYGGFVAEHKFHESRRWRFDLAWVDRKVALEIEGGVFMRGRHVRPSGFINDCEKYNAATLNGWRVYRIPVVKNWKEAALLYLIAEKLT